MFRFAAQMVIHLALQFFVDGLSQLADVAVRLPTHSGKPGGAVQPQREKIQNFLMFLAQFLHHAGNKGISGQVVHLIGAVKQDRKSTRLNSSHVSSSYAVFCLKKKQTKKLTKK